jgi:hypothetical protein
VAIRPGAENEPYEVFVADRGAGRVVRMRSDQAGKVADAVVDFADGDGPLGLLFIDRDRLVVACEDPPVLRLYELTDSTEPVSVDAAKQQITLSAESSGQAPCDFVALARSKANDKVPDLLVAAGRCLGNPRKIPVRAGTLDESAALLATEKDSTAFRLGGVAVSDRGYVVLNRRAVDKELLSFVNPIDGSIVMNVPIELQDINGLAYSPATGNLYAIATNANAAGAGGVFRVDDASQPGQPAATATKVADVRNPTALTFARDATLYVTADNATDDANDHRGTLLRIRGNL